MIAAAGFAGVLRELIAWTAEVSVRLSGLARLTEQEGHACSNLTRTLRGPDLVQARPRSRKHERIDEAISYHFERAVAGRSPVSPGSVRPVGSRNV